MDEEKDLDETEVADTPEQAPDENTDTEIAELVEERNESPSPGLDAQIASLRSDYSSLLARVDKIQADSVNNMLHEVVEESATIEKQQNTDIVRDNEILDYDDLWKEREG